MISDQQIGLTIQTQLIQAFQAFSSEMLQNFSLNPNLASLPVVVRTKLLSKYQAHCRVLSQFILEIKNDKMLCGFHNLFSKLMIPP